MARVYLVAGLGFGDESKGSITDFLTRSTGAKLVVRYNGGANAGHHVVLPDGRSHCFSQFGSGTFVPGVGTHLSKHMMVNPLFMFSEANHLLDLGVPDVWQRMTVDREALVTNPFQVAVNRLKELYRGDGRHGSCGMGIGETMQDFLEHPEDALRVRDLEDPVKTERLLRFSQERKIAEMEAHGLRPRGYLEGVSRANVEFAILQDTGWAQELATGLYRDWANKVRLVDEDYLTQQVNGEGVVIFEGAQGVLLDENFGFHPHTTWSTTTFRNAYDLLREHTDEETRVGVMRSYMTRHGAGPLVTEDPDLKFHGEHNTKNEWQQGFRVGHFDLEMYSYALRVLGGIELLALTHMDRVKDTVKVCVGYDDDEHKVNLHNSAWQVMDAIRLFGEKHHLDRQAKITQTLLKAKPLYQVIKTEELLRHLKAPTMLYSYGPTFEDKTFNAHHHG
jgi:adenylosuccinate synthase